jgi:hypothetical protein
MKKSLIVSMALSLSMAANAFAGQCQIFRQTEASGKPIQVDEGSAPQIIPLAGGFEFTAAFDKGVFQLSLSNGSAVAQAISSNGDNVTISLAKVKQTNVTDSYTIMCNK